MDFRDDLREALKVLREGGVILYPTDTVWGLGCDATSREAVEKIFEIKKRKEGQSLIILVNGITMLERYVREVPETASRITELSDSPVTIIYPRGRNLAPGVCGEDGSVGVRITGDGFCNELISLFRKPIVSTSANLSNKPSPSYFSDIEEIIVNSVSYVVKHRRGDRKKYTPSPIIKTESNGSFKIIRQ